MDIVESVFIEYSSMILFLKVVLGCCCFFLFFVSDQNKEIVKIWTSISRVYDVYFQIVLDD